MDILEKVKKDIKNMGTFELEDLEVEIKNHNKINENDMIILTLIDKEIERRLYLDKLERQGIKVKY